MARVVSVHVSGDCRILEDVVRCRSETLRQGLRQVVSGGNRRKTGENIAVKTS